MSRKTYRLYMDDSGSRHPDRKPTEAPAKRDWFALGGILICETDLSDAEASIDEFKSRWPEIGEAPLHSSAIRSRSGSFHWLASASARRKDQFMDEISALMTSLPIVVVACVVDRPGYNHRYKERYGRQRWDLCKTAFSIAVERSAKFAQVNGARLRVYVEQSGKKIDGRLRHYFDQLREVGAPFDATTSAKYRPLDGESLRRTLFEFQVKPKASRLMQVADLALWPVCMGGYDSDNRSYTILKQSGKLIDTYCTADGAAFGIKYSCFDLVDEAQKQKPA